MKQTFAAVVDQRYQPLARALLASGLVSLLLFFIRVAGAENFRFWFLFWNLLLGAVPLGFALLLANRLQKTRWLTGLNIVLTFLWIGFLPNSFYIVTDLIHVHITGEINILFDVVMIVSFIFNSYVLGFMSLYIVHKQLLRRVSPERAHLSVGLTLFICSFAIYLGRYLRWNSWDVLAHPFDILFDVSNRIINPADYPQTVTTTFIFFLLLTSMYWVVYEFAQLLRGKQR